jgi:hypothetical protein
MPGTPDARHGENYEEGIVFDNRSEGQDPTENGGVRYVQGSFSFRDSQGLFDPRSGFDHDSVDDLIHNIAESCYEEITRSSGRVSNITYWTDDTKTTKVREVAITRSSGRVSQLDCIQYNGSGTEIQRMTGVITRTSGRISSIDWTETGS